MLRFFFNLFKVFIFILFAIIGFVFLFFTGVSSVVVVQISSAPGHIRYSYKPLYFSR